MSKKKFTQDNMQAVFGEKAPQISETDLKMFGGSKLMLEDMAKKEKIQDPEISTQVDEPIPKTKASLKVSDTLVQKIKYIAFVQKTSITAIAERLLEKHIAEFERKKGTKI